jgi:thymidylate synthase (FAD)
MPSEVFFYESPVVTLIARPQFIEPSHMPVNWLGDSTDGEKLVEFAGRLCYMSQNNPANRTTENYLAHIQDSGHGSVMEHANYSCLVEGVSRSLTHEWVRHRAGWAYSQLSQRFVDESDCAFVVPPALITGTHEMRATFHDACLEALKRYSGLSEQLYEEYKDFPDKTMRRKRAREAARSVLPNATETKIILTGNVRAWRTVLGLRGDPIADAEINRLARKIATQLKAEAPNFFSDCTVTLDAVLFAHHKV